MMENKKKKIFCGAAVLVIIVAISSTANAQFLNMRKTSVLSETSNVNATFNDNLDAIYNVIKTLEETGRLNKGQASYLKLYTRELLRILEIVGRGCLIFSYGYGYASFIPSDPFPELTNIWISSKFIISGYWEYTDDSGATALFCVNDMKSHDIRGPQLGRIEFGIGAAIGKGATPATQGEILICGIFFHASVRPFTEELPVSEDFEERSTYNRKEYIKNASYCERMLNNQDIPDVITDHLQVFEQVVKPLASFNQTTYDHHEPIHINGDNDFKKPVEENGVIGGYGTNDDPYVIENWDINAESDTGILIENTEAYFIINNCYVHDGGFNVKSGIIFKQVKHGVIRNCNVSGNDNGIFLFNSTDNKLTDCSFFGNEGNIYLNKAKHNEIIGCTSKDGGSGIWNVYGSSNNHIINCDIQNNFIGMTLLFSSSNNYVTGCNISRNSFGILSIFSWDNKINFNNICNNGNEQPFVGMLTMGSIENATDDWWGSNDGPGGKGPGSGDGISWIRGNIAFEPWLTEPI